jgi:arylsulfatase A-like enzyme
VFFRRPKSTENFLLVTYDSCRFDSYEAAKTSVVDAYVVARKAWSQATYTYPSHASMFQGMLPHVFTDEEYYNRFVRQLWRKEHRKVGGAPAVGFPSTVKSIIDGFNRMGYYTCAAAAMGWFRNNMFLQQHWQSFTWTGIDARKQVAWTKDQISRHRSRPFFAFINFGETHAPYRFGDDVKGSEGAVMARPKNRKSTMVEDWQLDEERWRSQVACVEFLDAQMGELLTFFSEMGRDVTVVMCGDHGDCLGEDGLWGHGFYHPKVMEVPMGIFKHPGSEH